MKKELSKTSIKTQLFLIVCIILCFVFFVNFLLNNIFLEKYYTNTKIDELISFYDAINNDEDNYSFDLFREASIKNINIITTDKDYNIDLYITNDTNKFNNEIMPQGLIQNKNLQHLPETKETNERFKRVDDSLKQRLIEYSTSSLNFEQTIIKKNNNYIIYKSYDNFLSLYKIEIFGILENGNYFLLSTPLDSIVESVNVLNRFTIFSFPLCIFIGFILIFMFSKQFTNPIVELCNLSKKMKNLNFDENFNGNYNKEINELGENFNSLANSLKHNIEELQKSNLQLEKDLKEKIEIDELRKEFISNVSHELKTPIAIIQGYSEELIELDNDEDRKYYCDIIVDEAKKMNNMVRLLINLNHLESGIDVIENEQFNLYELISNCIKRLEIKLKEKDIHCIINISNPTTIYADAFKIEQIIINFLTNAINHIDENKQIVITTKKVDNKIRLSIFNSGKNIANEELDKIWIKFYKVDKARTREYGGSGIGLSIVAAIMKMYGEDYGVLNKDNGVEFWVNLKTIE